jgi:hypothetical protein
VLAEPASTGVPNFGTWLSTGRVFMTHLLHIDKLNMTWLAVAGSRLYIGFGSTSR